MLFRDSKTVRTSAALPAAGAYDTTPTVIDLDRLSTEVELLITYTRGAAGGSCKFKILSCIDGSTLFERTIDDGDTSSPANGESDSNLYTSGKTLPVAVGAGAERRSYLAKVPTRYFAVAFAEVGNTGAPGTVACVAAVVGST